MNDIMTPEHELWQEFVDRLSGPEGCNISKDNNGDLKWYCSGGSQTKAIAILESIPGINVEKSLLYFEEHGGYCDCEILLNVDKTTDFSKTILGPCNL